MANFNLTVFSNLIKLIKYFITSIYKSVTTLKTYLCQSDANPVVDSSTLSDQRRSPSHQRRNSSPDVI